MLKRKWSVQSLSFNQHVTFLLVASNSDFHLKCGNLGGDWSVVLQPPRNNVRECSKSFCGKWIWRRVYKLYLIYEHLRERMDWSLSPYYELSCLGIGLMNSSGSYTDAEDQQPSETSTFAFLRRWAVVWECLHPGVTCTYLPCTPLTVLQGASTSLRSQQLRGWSPAWELVADVELNEQVPASMRALALCLLVVLYIRIG